MKWSPFIVVVIFICFAIMLGFAFGLLNLIPIVNIFTWPLFSILNATLWVGLFITIFVVTIKMACGGGLPGVPGMPGLPINLPK